MKLFTNDNAVLAVGTAAACGACWLGTWMLGVGPAHADDSEFLYTVHQAGMWNAGGDVVLVEQAYEVCHYINQGHELIDAVDWFLAFPGSRITFQQSEMFVAAATAEYCPQLIHSQAATPKLTPKPTPTPLPPPPDQTLPHKGGFANQGSERV